MLAIILVHYHTPHLLVKAVKALEADIKLAQLPAEILVVDNGSTQAEQAIIKDLPVIYINSGKNLVQDQATFCLRWSRCSTL